MTPLRLETLDAAGRDAFLARQEADYAAAKVRAGTWSPGEAAERAREEIRRLVEDPSPPVPHEFLRGVGADGQVVGWLWVGPVPGEPSAAQVRWLYQITIDEPLRGRGLGRALLHALEAHLRARGVRELRLNVFTWNRVAMSLYESSGYAAAASAPGSIEMRKRLA